MNNYITQYRDPKTKTKIKIAIYEQLYDPVADTFMERLKSIIFRNTAEGKFTHPSFRYKGEIYKWGDETPPLKSNPLLPQFIPEMDSYLKDVRDINEKEISYVLGYVNQVLNSSNSLQDYLRLLPDSLHNTIRNMADSSLLNKCNLSEESVQTIQHNNHDAIMMMKHRMALNLII